MTQTKRTGLEFATAMSLALAMTSPAGAQAPSPEDGGAITFDVATCDTVGIDPEPPAPPNAPGDFAEPLPAETLGQIERLDAPYPDSWVVIHDVNFMSIIDGRFVVYDAAADREAYKGSVHGGMVGSFDIAPERNELYVATTYYTRGVSGDRADVISVHDACTLNKTAEIALPPGLMSALPFKNRFRLSNDRRYAFAFNFTPATSVTVVDLVERRVLSEVDVPGCSLAYPMNENGFASVCGDGSLLGINLDEAGEVTSQTRTEAVVDLDADPMFLKAARLGDQIYFPTFYGSLHGFDLAGDTPVHLGEWSITSDEESEAGWRPGGWQLIAANEATGEIFVLMHPEGGEGTHKNPGSEVWVFDVSSEARTRAITLQTPAFSLATAGNRLLAINIEMNIDVYDAATGELERTIEQPALLPYQVYSATGR